MNNLEERSLNFARNVRDYCKNITHGTINSVYLKQVIRSSSSIGANYIEANEALGKLDRIMKMRIARKEAKETIYWMNLLEHEKMALNTSLKNEAEELKKILSTIIAKLTNNNS